MRNFYCHFCNIPIHWWHFIQFPGNLICGCCLLFQIQSFQFLMHIRSKFNLICSQLLRQFWAWDFFVKVAQDYIDSEYKLDSSPEVDEYYHITIYTYLSLCCDVHEQNLMIQSIVAQRENIKESYINNLFDIGDLTDFKSNFVIYMALIVTTIILSFVAIRNCQKTKIRQSRKKREVSNYGTLRV